MTGQQYVERLSILRTAWEAAREKAVAASAGTPEYFRRKMAEYRRSLQLILNKMAEMTRSFDDISLTDPWYGNATIWKNRELSDSRFKDVNWYLNIAIDASTTVRGHDAAFHRTITKYLLDDWEKVGRRVEEIRDDLIEAAQKGAKTLQQFSPMIIIGGGGSIVFPDV